MAPMSMAYLLPSESFQYFREHFKTIVPYHRPKNMSNAKGINLFRVVRKFCCMPVCSAMSICLSYRRGVNDSDMAHIDEWLDMKQWTDKTLEDFIFKFGVSRFTLLIRQDFRAKRNTWESYFANRIDGNFAFVAYRMKNGLSRKKCIKELFYAAENNHILVTRAILVSDDIYEQSITTKEKNEALKIACDNESMEMVQLLIQMGASISPTCLSMPIVLYAIQSNRVDIARWLVDKGAPIPINNHSYDSFHTNPIHKLIEDKVFFKNVEIVEYLVEIGWKFTIGDMDTAITMGRKMMIDIIKYHMDFDQIDTDTQETLLIKMCKGTFVGFATSFHKNLFAFVVDHTSLVDTKDEYETTAMEYLEGNTYCIDEFYTKTLKMKLANK